MKNLMIIVADTNDADYVHSLNYVSEEEINLVKGIVAKLNKLQYGGFAWKTGDIGSPSEDYKDILTDDEMDIFGDYVPYGQYGTHTIESIRILEVSDEETLL